MRQLIIERLQHIEKNTGFSGSFFHDFFIGGYHISEHPPFHGMPHEILLTVYEEIIKHFAISDGLLIFFAHSVNKSL